MAGAQHTAGTMESYKQSALLGAKVSHEPALQEGKAGGYLARGRTHNVKVGRRWFLEEGPLIVVPEEASYYVAVHERLHNILEWAKQHHRWKLSYHCVVGDFEEVVVTQLIYRLNELGGKGGFFDPRNMIHNAWYQMTRGAALSETHKSYAIKWADAFFEEFTSGRLKLPGP